MPFFHSFSGCDTTSSFFGTRKKMAWDGSKSYPDVTEVFMHIALNPYYTITDCDNPYFKLLE